MKTKETLITASAYRVVYDLKTQPKAEEYTKYKLGINNTVFEVVNWTAIGAYIKQLAISQRVKVMKYIYDWQNVGSQKQLHRWADIDEYECPYACGNLETPLHYLRCTKTCTKMSRMCLEAINKWMIIAKTNNMVRVRIMDFLYEELPFKQGGLLF